MSNVFNESLSNLGSAALEKATQERNKYNQELTKKEMISQTEESLGGIKLFTSGRELGAKILKESKIKPYLKQQIDKALGKAKKPTRPTKPTKPTETTTGEEELGDLIKPEIKIPLRVQNDISDERLARIGRIAKTRKARKIEKGMSEEDAEADSNNFIQGEVDRIMNKNKLNNSLEKSTQEANDQAQAEFKAATEARANLKAAGKDKPTTKGKGKGGEDEELGAGDEEAAAGAEEGAEISGVEAIGSVLDAIPGLDLIGAALGIGGLAAGFTKKPPQEIMGQMTRGQNSYSSQIGLN